MEKKPFLTEAMAQEIIQDVPTPFHVYDEKGIRENARRINKAFSWNKGFKEYFAVKALPNPVILQILQEEGCGVDCSSLTELMLSEVCGFTGSDIMFSSNQTPVEDMQKAYELGAYINLDDATMVDFLDRVAGVPETVFCRYNPGGTFSLGESEEGFQVMDKPGDAKYGMTEEQMIDSYKKLMAKGAKHFGIHAFLASNTISDAYYPELAAILFRLAVRVHEATGAHIGYINLSGGVGIPYRPEQTENDILAIGEGVRQKFEEILVPAGMGDVAIFTEMGRFTTGPYGALVATAIHEKHIYKEYIGLDACAANLMRPAMYGAYHHITVLGKEDAPCDHMYDVVGGLCENNDKFAIDRMLPKIDIGDVLYIHDTGAHIGYINLSGGVGIPYRPEQTENDILAIGEGVRKKFEEILVPAGMGDVAIFTEMGRFTTGPYGALVATAIHEKHIYKEYIGLDACAANLMRPAMYGAYHHITVLGKEDAPCDHMYDVVGGLCENNDKFAIDRMLPKIDIGDVLYIHDTGAHGSAMGYNYNGKLRSAEVLLCEDGSHRLIRRAETPRDYFATLDFLPLMKPLFED